MIKWNTKFIKTFSPQLKWELTQLWNKEPFGSPFVSPSFIELMVNRVVEKGERVVFGKGYDNKGNLSAIWPMRIDAQNNLRFLQYCFCDYTTALYDFQIDKQDLSEGISILIKKVKPSSIVFDTIPDWGYTLEALTKGIEVAGYHFNAFAYVKAPILRGRLGPEGTKQIEKQLCRHRSLKNYTNRLKREKGYFFEVDRTNKNIDKWVDQFCDAHDKRWEPTLTPSKYQDKQSVKDLKAVLHAWANDKLLIRFSIFIPPRRITYVVGLKSGNTIIYFHTARLPVYNKLGTGNITIRLIGLWMIENGYDSIDFGQGDEGYKYYFANETRNLWRIYASSSRFSLHYLKGCVEAYIRQKESRILLWEMSKKQTLVIRRYLRV